MKKELKNFTKEMIDRNSNEQGWAIAETMIAIVIGLIMLGGVFALVNIALSNSKVQNTEENIATIRSGVQQLYSTSRDYTGLENSILEKAGIIPENLLTSTVGEFKNGWNGDVVIEPDSEDPTLFTITYNDIPQKETIKLATFGVGSWYKVTLNDKADISQNGGTAVSDASEAAQDTNKITYTSN